VIREDAYKDLALTKVDVDNAPCLALGRSGDVKVLDSIIAGRFRDAEKIGVELSAYERKSECYSRIRAHSDASNRCEYRCRVS